MGSEKDFLDVRLPSDGSKGLRRRNGYGKIWVLGSQISGLRAAGRLLFSRKEASPMYNTSGRILPNDLRPTPSAKTQLPARKSTFCAHPAARKGRPERFEQMALRANRSSPRSEVPRHKPAPCGEQPS